MSYAEIAQSLTISVTAAKVRVHRARNTALRAREEQLQVTRDIVIDLLSLYPPGRSRR